MAFELPTLPYSTSALAAKKMCQETLEPHHGKHHQAYVTALNGFVAADASLQGKSLEDIVKSTAAEAAGRPAGAKPALARVRTAYAIYVVGISMLPRYEPGELVFVDPTKPVIKGNYVVVQIAGDAGEHQGYIKRYLGRDDHTLRLDQLNPKKKLAFPMNRVIAVHRIIMGGEA